MAKKTTKKVAKKTPAKVSPTKATTKSEQKKSTKSPSKKAVKTVVAEVEVKTAAIEAKDSVETADNSKKSKVEVVETKPTASSKKVEIAEAQARVNDEIAGLAENFSWEEIADAISSLDFFVDHRSDDCAEKGCDNLRTSQQYCRLHYMANWYDIQKKREILKEGKLQQYIEELVSKYPPKLIESLLSDLQDDKEFYKALNELNIHSDMELDDVEFDGAEDDDDADDDIAVETRNFTSSQRFEDEQ